MMKNFKLILISFAMIAGLFTSCSNNDSIVEEQNIDKTEAITESLNRLAQQFNAQGDVIPSANPSGNIVFDYCFDFVYPLNLSYNNGTTVSVSSLDDLITILINSTNDLFIDGVEFPFHVETYNGSGAIEIVTINNENEFYDLLESCDFDSVNTCECYEVFDPVCVEIQAPDGETFTITYPNECYALCDGFTPNDFIENCVNDYNNPGGNNCFEFVFPLTIVTNENVTITVNSQAELDNALYNAYYFDFVYSFDVVVNDELLTIGNEEAFIALLEDCFGTNDCPCPDNVDPVCVEVQSPNGGTEIITFPNACYAECVGYTPNDFVDCDDINNPSDCSEEEVVSYILECKWALTTSLYDNVITDYFEFIENGVLNVINQSTNESIQLGSWGIISDPQNEDVIFAFNTNDPYFEVGSYNWTVTQCSEGYILLESGNEFIQLERDCDNNGSDCNEETISGLLVQCQFWSVTISNQGYIYVFGNDGTVTVGNSAGNSVATGTWSTSTNSDGDVVVNVNTNSGNFSSDWTFLSCSINDVIIVESSATWMSNIESGCN